MMLYNDGFEYTLDSCGKLPMENSADFTPGQRSAIAWSGNKIKIRIPWTMLYFYDPSQLQVVNGAVSYDGGRSYQISTATTDGVAVSVLSEFSHIIYYTLYLGKLANSSSQYSSRKEIISDCQIDFQFFQCLPIDAR